MRPASGGRGPEFTASGVPQETHGSGDPDLPPISAPARPPSPRWSKARPKLAACGQARVSPGGFGGGPGPAGRGAEAGTLDTTSSTRLGAAPRAPPRAHPTPAPPGPAAEARRDGSGRAGCVPGALLAPHGGPFPRCGGSRRAGVIIRGGRALRVLWVVSRPPGPSLPPPSPPHALRKAARGDAVMCWCRAEKARKRIFKKKEFSLKRGKKKVLLLQGGRRRAPTAPCPTASWC